MARFRRREIELPDPVDPAVTRVLDAARDTTGAVDTVTLERALAAYRVAGEAPAAAPAAAATARATGRCCAIWKTPGTGRKATTSPPGTNMCATTCAAPARMTR